MASKISDILIKTMNYVEENSEEILVITQTALIFGAGFRLGRNMSPISKMMKSSNPEVILNKVAINGLKAGMGIEVVVKGEPILIFTKSVVEAFNKTA